MADYKDTVFLPRTDFPLRGNLPQREPEFLARWAALDLYALQRAAARGRPPHILHDGPPYANGNIHLGTALTKILKDALNRTRQMTGFDAPWVPGWDCHGLPIEWKIEEQYRARGKSKDDVPILQFRAECRAFADHWVAVQSAEFQRLGTIANWARPYTTMSFAAEAAIVAEIHKFLMNGLLYQGAKPVMWSSVEQTALAEAEVEYHDHVSPSCYVGFAITQPGRPELAGTRAVIWTTTPWTLPGNRAIACGAEILYGVYRVTAVSAESSVPVGSKLLVALERAAAVAEACGITAWEQAASLKGAELAGTVAAHPFAGQGYDFPVPLLQGDFVTTEAGTGLVHCAPGHGEDDFYLGQRQGLELREVVAADGTYYADVPLFGGLAVLTPKGKDGPANKAVLEKLAELGALFAQAPYTHSYPHSWRSRAPVLFRLTPQWFIAMDRPFPPTGRTLRELALAAVDATRFVPATGQNRLRSMVENRPDWCISRQRAWGVPIAMFVHRQSGELLRDPAVNQRIVAAFAAEGADAWYARPISDFLGPDYDAAAYEPVRDIVDVWFESGATHAFVCASGAWPELSWPPALYAEGTDQHRGWFQSSLLESCGTRGRAPYADILTSGFVLDEQGRKMSKSLGNVLAPEDVIAQYGADVLRLWVLGSDYTDDLRVGADIIRQQGEYYRRIRNTLRYLLGALAELTPAETIADPATMPALERWVLHRLAELDRQVRQAIAGLYLPDMVHALHQFCASDLSAFYFDIRKDSLYCDSRHEPVRRACRTVLLHLFDCLSAWLAPILPFTAEEAWDARPRGLLADDTLASVHLRQMPTVPAAWRDDALAAQWARLRGIRSAVTAALESARAEKQIGSSLQAAPELTVPPADWELVQSVPLADLCITSAVTLRRGDTLAVTVLPATGDKCARCWKVLPEVGQRPAHPALCVRCATVVEQGQ